MLLVLLFSINVISGAQDLKSTFPSTSIPFPTPYQGKQDNKSQIYLRRDKTLNTGQDNFKFISEHMNLMKLVNIMKCLFCVKSINSEKKDLKNPRLCSKFRRAHNTYSTANKTNIAGKSKLKRRNQNSSDNRKRNVYGEKKSWIQSVQKITKGQVQSDYSMKEKDKTKHDNNNKKDDFTKENIEAQKKEIEDAYSASNSSKERIHGQGHLIKLIIKFTTSSPCPRPYKPHPHQPTWPNLSQ